MKQKPKLLVGTLCVFFTSISVHDSGAMSRGCGTEMDQGQCWTCTDGDGCNNKTLNQCYSCNSTTDRSCVVPHSNSETNTTLCDGSCIQKIENGTYMIRGCESDELNCNDKDPHSFCQTCEGALCNSITTPLGTLNCHHCDTVDSCNDFDETHPSTPCLYYEPDDQCVQFYNGSAMFRGCASSSVGEQCQEQGEKCLRCDTSGCNNLPLERPGGIFCIQCSNEEYCSWGFYPIEGTLCTNAVLYYQNASCYTSTFNETAVTRGCTTTNEGCNSTDSTCQLCSGENCNNENIIKQYCIQCSSRQDINCSLGDATNSSVCPAEIQTYGNRGCYVRRDSQYIVRGCLGDLSDDVRQTCSEDENNSQCQMCLTADCNSQRLPNKSSTTEVSLTICLFFAIILHVF